jgi:hypothetical protein
MSLAGDIHCPRRCCPSSPSVGTPSVTPALLSSCVLSASYGNPTWTQAQVRALTLRWARRDLNPHGLAANGF